MRDWRGEQYLNVMQLSLLFSNWFRSVNEMLLYLHPCRTWISLRTGQVEQSTGTYLILRFIYAQLSPIVNRISSACEKRRAFGWHWGLRIDMVLAEQREQVYLHITSAPVASLFAIFALKHEMQGSPKRHIALAQQIQSRLHKFSDAKLLGPSVFKVPGEETCYARHDYSRAGKQA